MSSQEIFDVLDNAFSNFMVADMNNRRCGTYGMPEDEATYYAEHDGDRTGRIVASVCGDHAKLRDALYELLADSRHSVGEAAVDRIEGREVPEKDILVYLCGKYQHDEHRRPVCEAFASACLKAMNAVLKEV